jgi:prevent-host-death family protein
MKRVSIAEAKQTLPALIHEAERRGEIELTRRGKVVAYIVSAKHHARAPRRTFIESFEAWRDRYREDIGDAPLDLPKRRPPRDVVIGR